MPPKGFAVVAVDPADRRADLEAVVLVCRGCVVRRVHFETVRARRQEAAEHARLRAVVGAAVQAPEGVGGDCARRLGQAHFELLVRSLMDGSFTWRGRESLLDLFVSSGNPRRYGGVEPAEVELLATAAESGALTVRVCHVDPLPTAVPEVFNRGGGVAHGALKAAAWYRLRTLGEAEILLEPTTAHGRPDLLAPQGRYWVECGDTEVAKANHVLSDGYTFQIWPFWGGGRIVVELSLTEAGRTAMRTAQARRQLAAVAAVMNGP